MYGSIRNDHPYRALSNPSTVLPLLNPLLLLLLLASSPAAGGFLRPPRAFAALRARSPATPMSAEPGAAATRAMVEAAFLDRLGLSSRPTGKAKVDPRLTDRMDSIATKFGTGNTVRTVFSDGSNQTALSAWSLRFPLDVDCARSNIRGALLSLSLRPPPDAHAMRVNIHDSSLFSHLIDTRFLRFDQQSADWSRTRIVTLELDIDRSAVQRWLDQNLRHLKLDADVQLFSRNNTSRVTLLPANDSSTFPELDLIDGDGPNRLSLSTFCADPTRRSSKRDTPPSLRAKRDTTNVLAQRDSSDATRRRRVRNGTNRHHRRRNRSRRHRHRHGARARPRYRVDWCQRKSLIVSFEQLEWDDWIVAPKGYQAFYCAGSCAWVGRGEAGNTTNHAVLQAIYNSVDGRKAPAPCCVPTRLSPQSLVYYDEKGAVVFKMYDDMIVEECGCA